MRGLVRLLLVAWFMLGGLVLVARELLLPGIGAFREEIAAAASGALGLPVRIEAIEGEWRGLRPRLRVAGLVVADAQGRPALRLPQVDATLAWRSLLRLSPDFHRLEIVAPELGVRRAADGRVFVAGLALGAAGERGGVLDWLLQQRELVVRDATLVWRDELRGAPDLRLEAVAFRFERGLLRHRFALHARPPAALASRLELRGELGRLDVTRPLESVGRLQLALERAELGAWEVWVDYPLPLAGRGGVRAWVELDGGRTSAITADLALDEVRTRLAPELAELRLDRLDGRLAASRGPDGLDLSIRGLRLVSGDGLHLAPTDVSLALVTGADAGGRLRATRLELAALAGLAAQLPLPAEVRRRLAAFAPQGEVSDLRLEWRGEAGAPAGWSLAGRFTGIGLAAEGRRPGMSGLSGAIEGNERSGRFRLDGRDVGLALPGVFADGPLTFASLQATGGWERREAQLEVVVDALSFDNPDAAGSAAGRYRTETEGAGEIELKAQLSRADGTAVWRYLPRVVSERTQSWVRKAVQHARVEGASLQLQGRLADFPFRDGKGHFEVVIGLRDGVLDYAPGWPAIEGIDGELRFAGPGLRVEAERARVFGVALGGVVADIPDLDTRRSGLMTITGRARGPSTDFLRFIAESPLAARIGALTDALQVEGEGELALRLAMPLKALADTEVQGEYRFADNRVGVLAQLPPIERAAGRVRFTRNGLSISGARGRWFGEPLRLAARTGSDGALRFEAEGGAKVKALQAAFGWPWLTRLSGSTAWQGTLQVRRGGFALSLEAPLEGLASSLPHPLAKRAEAALPLRLKLANEGGDAPTRLEVSLAELLHARLSRTPSDGDGAAAIAGGIGIGEPVREAERGVMVAARLDALDVDAWRHVLGALDDEAEGKEEGGGASALPLAGVALQCARLHVFGQDLAAVDLRAVADDGGWRARLRSDRADGEFDWRNAGDGTLHARFARLELDGGEGDKAESESGQASRTPPRRLPGLDITAERFVLRERELGRLELLARNRGGLWRLERVHLRNEDGQLEASGQWQASGRQRTRLDFRLETADIGRFSRRLGYPDAVRGGHATLGGELEWRGAPTRIDYPTLAGTMRVEAEAGQFNKLEPGVGRLLGVLSLQALPRRITLDFRDVFSEGFAFDRISGSIGVARGVLRTDDLEIRGPAARIMLAGNADLAAESQDLRVLVQPTLSESIAIGAAAGLVNPVAGVVTYLAQKVLSDPIERLFSYEYTITGSWSDPQVARSNAAAPPATPQR